MIAVDTNILIYAHRAESRLHASALARMRALAEGDVAWGLPVFVLGEFVRVVTHPRLFAPATSHKDAFAFLDHLMESPAARFLLPGPAFASYLRAACEAADATGNLVFDAQIAAVCQENGVAELLTADRDFTRFRGIRPVFL